MKTCSRLGHNIFFCNFTLALHSKTILQSTAVVTVVKTDKVFECSSWTV